MSQDTIRFICSSCQYRARIPARYAGKTIACPKCSTAQEVVADTGPSAGGTELLRGSQSQVTDRFVFTCSECGHRARMANKYRGLSIKCPSCSAKVKAEPAPESSSIAGAEQGEGSDQPYSQVATAQLASKDIEQANERLRQQEASAKPMDSGVLAKRSDTQAAIDVLAKDEGTDRIQRSSQVNQALPSNVVGAGGDESTTSPQLPSLPAFEETGTNIIISDEDSNEPARKLESQEDITNSGMLALPASVLEEITAKQQALPDSSASSDNQKTAPNAPALELSPLAEPPQPAPLADSLEPVSSPEPVNSLEPVKQP